MKEVDSEPNPPFRILVLDDDENVGQFVRGVLRGPKYQTIWCRSVDQAIEEAQNSLPDLALIDIGLEGAGTGWDLLKFLRSAGADHVPAVMLTGASDTVNRAKALRMGADRFLIKPVGAATLRRVVNEMLGEREDLWWIFNLPPGQIQRMRELFVDSTTELATLAIVVDDLRKLVESGEGLQVFCLEIEPLFRLGERNYWEMFDQLRREFVRGLHVMVSPLLGNDVTVATSHAGANDFYCFARKYKGVQTQTTRALERSARSAMRALSVAPEIADEVMIFAGGSTTQPQPLYAPRILYNAVREAKDSAERRETRFYHALRERLARAIHAGTIRTVFQPVLNLQTREIYGYEALSRGPSGSDIENPQVIFEIARDFDLVWDLERMCIENVRPFLDQISQRGYLFFNLESHFIQQIQQRGTEVFEPFFQYRNSIVIEVTERSAIRDYRTFRRTLHNLKLMGFRIAIDDCGSGYATLEAVAELQPDYLKVGHSLFHGLESDPIRTRLVDLVARAAESIGAETIAEAIETEEQLRICQSLGIQHGQGFLFAYPTPWDEISAWMPGSTSTANNF